MLLSATSEGSGASGCHKALLFVAVSAGVTGFSAERSSCLGHHSTRAVHLLERNREGRGIHVQVCHHAPAMVLGFCTPQRNAGSLITRRKQRCDSSARAAHLFWAAGTKLQHGAPVEQHKAL